MPATKTKSEQESSYKDLVKQHVLKKLGPVPHFHRLDVHLICGGRYRVNLWVKQTGGELCAVPLLSIYYSEFVNLDDILGPVVEGGSEAEGEPG